MSESASTSTQECTAPRNTINGARVRSWVFTWNNYSEDDKKLMAKWLEEECDKCGMQPEVGENGTPHLQGWFHLRNAKTFEAIKKKWPKIHLEVCKNINAAKNYCRKEKTKAGESFELDDSELKKPPRDRMEGKTLKPWQEDVMNIIAGEPDERKIYWFYEENGGAGKTTLAKSICLNNRKRALYLNGKTTDILSCVASHVQKFGESSLKVALFNFPRCCEGKIPYKALESVKDGVFFNGKYESGMVLMEIPHIIVFANMRPDESKLSRDRWIIRNIDPPQNPDELL